MKRILLFLIGIFATVNMLADVVNDFFYQGMTFSYDTDTHLATLTDGKMIASSNVEIPGSFVEGGIQYTVTTIGNDAFKGNTNNINHVIIPEEVTTIGANAFNGCSNLGEVNVGKSVSNIGSKAFANLSAPAAARRAKTRGASGLVIKCYATSVPTTAADAFENTSIGNANTTVLD